MPGYKKTNLDLENPPNWLTSLKDKIELRALGITVTRLPAGKGYTFLHQHKEQEEVYMVINGNGIIHIDGENIPITKGDFIGSDIIIKQLNNGVSKIRVGIKPEGRIIARGKTKIFNQSDVHIGEITSGTFGPSVNGPVAMGYVENEFSKKNTKVFLEVRGKKYPASVCSLPFYNCLLYTSDAADE